MIASSLADYLIIRNSLEHQAAVESLVEKLAPFATDLQVSKASVGTAKCITATDVSAELTSSTSILDLVMKSIQRLCRGTPRKQH